MSKPEESRFVPYEAVRHFGVERVLVFAPHADDEVFGCGGALALHVCEQAVVQVVVLTDGAAGTGGHGDAGGLVAVREAESVTAAGVLGYEEPEFWHLPDRGLRYDETLVTRVKEALVRFRPERVYAPSPFEVHPDHRACALAVLEAARRHDGGDLCVALYEVGRPLPDPNLLVDISSVLALKQTAMGCFVSQLAVQAYDEQVGALNRYRTYTLGHPVLAAEAYRVVTARTLCAAEALRAPQAMPCPLPCPAPGAPLVSVLVRSMNRSSLQQALDAVAAQTYPCIEIVVVNAFGSGHQPLPARWGHCSLRLVNVEGPALPRGAAANRALEEASGALLMFLDDDDSIFPDHLAKLVAKLQERGECVAAHADVRAVNAQDGTLVYLFDVDAPVVRLRFANYLPIHAVLFRREAVLDGCRVDESLEIFEDWDFWLQVSRLGPFVRAPGVSAEYRVMHDAAHPVNDAEKIRLWRDRVLEKWGIGLDRPSFDALYAYVEQLEVRERQARMAPADADAILEARAALVAMQSSLSWRVTAPLRALLGWLGRFGKRVR